MSAKNSGNEGAAKNTPAAIFDQITNGKKKLLPSGWEIMPSNWKIGSGFYNKGKTCYMNAVIQSFFHTPTIAYWLIMDYQHYDQCKDAKKGMGDESPCIICGLRATLRATQTECDAIDPYYVYTALGTQFSDRFSEEDAHEFFRALIMALDESYLIRCMDALSNNIDIKISTTFEGIFSGCFRSTVECTSCNHISIRDQDFLDLMIDNHSAVALEDALFDYFDTEVLATNDFMCAGCGQRVRIKKDMKIKSCPVVLCIQINRFTSCGKKLNTHLNVPVLLDLKPYVIEPQPDGVFEYKLTSVINHYGRSKSTGHYTAVCATKHGDLYEFDDTYVEHYATRKLRFTDAYLIFYEIIRKGQSFDTYDILSERENPAYKLKKMIYNPNETSPNRSMKIPKGQPSEGNKSGDNSPTKIMSSCQTEDCYFIPSRRKKDDGQPNNGNARAGRSNSSSPPHTVIHNDIQERFQLMNSHINNNHSTHNHINNSPLKLPKKHSAFHIHNNSPYSNNSHSSSPHYSPHTKQTFHQHENDKNHVNRIGGGVGGYDDRDVDRDSNCDVGNDYYSDSLPSTSQNSLDLPQCHGQQSRIVNPFGFGARLCRPSVNVNQTTYTKTNIKRYRNNRFSAYPNTNDCKSLPRRKDFSRRRNNDDPEDGYENNGDSDN